MRTRDDAFGTQSGVGADGSVVTPSVEVLLEYRTLTESAPLRWCRYCKEVLL